MSADRRQVFAWLVAGLGCWVWLASGAALGQGDGLAPKRKDTNARLRPAEVKVETRVDPADAKPGDTVTYSVTATVERPWHIYAFVAKQPEEGPRGTQFDFFDTAGLSLGKTWNPDRAPTRQKEPAFPNLEAVEFYSGRVTWSIPLTIPADAQPGKHLLRNQIYFQICNETACKPPVYVTVPDVTVTVSATSKGKGASLFPVGRALISTALLAGFGDDPAQAPSAPRMADSNVARRPVQVSLSASVEPAEARPGESVVYHVKANIEEPWHIYAHAKTQPEGQTALSTKFDFFDAAGLNLAGDWTADRPAKVEPEPGAPDQPVAFHENEVIWSVPLKVPDDAKAEARVLRNQILFQICTQGSCLAPTYWTLPDVALTILPGTHGGANEASSTPSTEARRVEPADEATASNNPVAADAGEKSVAPLAPTAPSASPQTVQEAIAQGWWSFLLFSALGGVAALLMPCVWPMVPITVNFFVKQGQVRKDGSTTALAITYCVSIIAIFTFVGVLCSAFLGATALPKLANNGWLNLFVSVVFIAFGLSLLGLFEIRLPAFVLNASAQNESRGGLIGIVFMALTLVITSFTCTFPVVGGLLFLATKGSYLYPIVGMLVFSTVLALPFFLLALMPGQLSRLPRSGDWMNAVKVVGGLIEIGAAFKFLNVAEIGFGATPKNAWIDAQVVLAVWVVLAIVCGIYLLGVFRTSHDQEITHVGPVRILFGSAFLFLALYLAPALFGFPPKGQVYDRLIVGILPADSDELSTLNELIASTNSRADSGSKNTPGLNGNSRSVTASIEPVKATSSDPNVAIRQERYVAEGIPWGFSLEAALEEAKSTNRPVLIDFTGVNCPSCRNMERGVFPKEQVKQLMKQFVTVRLYGDQVPIDSITDNARRDLAEANQNTMFDLVDQNTMPYYVALSPEGKVIAQIGFTEVPNFVAFLQSAIDTHRDGAKVAQK